MADELKNKNIEEMVEKHTAKMRLIKGNSHYKFDMLDFVMYLSSIEAKAKSPPVVMHQSMKDITLGTVYGKD